MYPLLYSTFWLTSVALVGVAEPPHAVGPEVGVAVSAPAVGTSGPGAGPSCFTCWSPS